MEENGNQILENKSNFEDEELEESDCTNSDPAEIEDKHFDFQRFYHYMKECIIENEEKSEDIDLEKYLLAYEQLLNFFMLLGAAFQFVAVDVRSKIKILKSHRRNEIETNQTVKNFLTVKSMIDYEIKNNLLTNPKYVSGSRTLLRLHRGLNFVRNFLKEIYSLENNTKLCSTARDVYNRTLAEFHSWMVRSAARVAMQLLPTKIQLLERIAGDNNEEKITQILGLFPDAVETMDLVYDRIQTVYSENKLLDLP